MGKSEAFCLCSWGPCSINSGYGPYPIALYLRPLQVFQCSQSAVRIGLHALV